MAVAISAADTPAPSLATYPCDGTDMSADLTEGQSFYAYIVLSPFEQINTSYNYVYRVAQDTLVGQGKVPGSSTNKLSDVEFTVTWDKTSLQVDEIYTYPDSTKPGTKKPLEDEYNDYKYAFYAKAATTRAASPEVEGVGSGDSNLGTATISYGSTVAGGFVVNNDETVVPNAVVARIKFTVITGAAGGDVEIKLNNSYKYDSTAYSAAEVTTTVSVAKGCNHDNKTKLTDTELASKGYENVAATCITKDTVWYYCSDCDDYIAVSEVGLLEHNYTVEKYITEPTCTSAGAKAMFCSVDANCTAYDTDTVETVAKLGHDFGESSYVYLAPTCTADGYGFYCCPRCNHTSMNGSTADTYTYINGVFYNVSGAEIDMPDAAVIEATGHDWVYSHTTDGVVYYNCANGCGESMDVAAADTVRYVTTSGTGDGATVDTPTTLAKAFEHFSNMPEAVDCTIYLVGTVKLNETNKVSTANTATKNFEEFPHDAHITITTAPGKSKATLFFPFSTVSQYYLYGPTTFDNIYISSDAKGTSEGKSESVTIYARGFDIEMTENVVMKSTASPSTIAYSKTDGSWDYASSVSLSVPACKVYLCGGFPSTNAGYDGLKSTTDGYTCNMTINGGTYWVVAGGSRSVINATNCEFNISIGGKAKIGQLVPINTGAINASGTIVNIHYYGGTIAAAYRGEMATRTTVYTVNHFFHNGCGVNLKVGDFLMGAKHAKNVNCYYSVSDLSAPSAKDYGLAFIKKGNINVGYSETNENLPFPEWCMKYVGEHDYVDGKCSFCDIQPCSVHTTKTVVSKEANCGEEGEQYKVCTVCYEQVGEVESIPVDPTAHDYQWDNIVGGKTTFTCSHCGAKGSYSGENTGVYYVSDNGKGNGGFSADYPLNDYLEAIKLAAAYDGDATIYIVGSITINPNYSFNNTVFVEPDHDNTITICGYKNSGIFKFPAVTSTGKTVYAMNGNTTFENIEFSNSNSKHSSGYFYLAAQHNHLILGENITIDYQRNSSSGYNICTPVIFGGCYHNKYNADGSYVSAANCTGEENNITIYSGSYYELFGGSIGSSPEDVADLNSYVCNGGNTKVNISILGDVSFRDCVALGGHAKGVGDITFTLDGSLSVGNYFAISGVNATSDCTLGKAENVTLYIYSGAIHTQNAQSVTGATTVRPIGATYYPNADGEYDVTMNVKSLTVYYDPSNESAKGTAMRFSYADASQITEFKIIDTAFCEVNKGEHTIGETKKVVESICSAQGYGTYVCSACGETYTVSLDPVAHKYGETAMAYSANCVDPQIDKTVCTDCGFILYSVNADNPATGIHSYGEDGICVYCNLNLQDVCEHMWGEETTVTTGCGTGTQKTCTICGKAVIDITSADHKFGAYTVTVQPTATEPGIKTRTCKSCGKVETAIIYADGSSVSASAIATDANGNLADLDVVTNKLTSAEKTVLNALLQNTAYGSEVKVSYQVEGDTITNITYSIPLPAEYADMQNVQVIVKDDNGDLHVVQFTIDKGYIVFTF